jgi:hypothetical protein
MLDILSVYYFIQRFCPPWFLFCLVGSTRARVRGGKGKIRAHLAFGRKPWIKTVFLPTLSHLSPADLEEPHLKEMLLNTPLWFWDQLPFCVPKLPRYFSSSAPTYLQ